MLSWSSNSVKETIRDALADKEPTQLRARNKVLEIQIEGQRETLSIMAKPHDICKNSFHTVLFAWKVCIDFYTISLNIFITYIFCPGDQRAQRRKKNHPKSHRVPALIPHSSQGKMLL